MKSILIAIFTFQSGLKCREKFKLKFFFFNKIINLYRNRNTKMILIQFQTGIMLHFKNEL